MHMMIETKAQQLKGWPTVANKTASDSYYSVG